MQLPLVSGAYVGQSLIANAQRCVNLYPEKNQEDAPFPFTHYPTPGLKLLASSPLGVSPSRGLYTATNGNLYRIVGNSVYSVDSAWVHTLLGTMATSTGMCYMIDNGLVMVIVDGSSMGYCVDIASNNYGTIAPSNFYGGNRVQYLDTYFLLNKPGTQIWYISLSLVTFAQLVAGTAFNALDFAAKVGYADPLITLSVVHREVWLLGSLTGEVWYNSGAADFTYEQLPGAFIEHGIIAVDSVAEYDLGAYWVSRDKAGIGMVLKGSQYVAERITTHAIETELSKYSTISDAVGKIYQQRGHVFYVLTFPTADKTWVYDESQRLWHERASIDNNGVFHAVKFNCLASAYGKIVAGDTTAGTLYQLDIDTYKDLEMPIPRIRSWPHLLDDDKRVIYPGFAAKMGVGEDDGSLDSTSQTNPPVVFLRWSDDGGKTFGNAMAQSLGALGQWKTDIQWNRLGMGRDRVFELSWSVPAKTALNGAYLIPPITCGS